jgi:hypothetical protein
VANFLSGVESADKGLQMKDVIAMWKDAAAATVTVKVPTQNLFLEAFSILSLVIVALLVGALPQRLMRCLLLSESTYRSVGT